MALVPLLDTSDDPQATKLIEKLKAGRRGSLLGIYKALLHNPALAETWFEHLNTVRWGTDLSGRLRELLIIRIGHQLRSAYIIKQHVPKLAKVEGLTDDDCQRLMLDELAGFSDAELAALKAADELTRASVLPPELGAGLREHFTDRQIVEMMVLIGTYNMHARFVAGLNIELEQD